MHRLLFPAFLIAFILTGCGRCIVGSGIVQDEDRLLPSFTEIHLNCSAGVVLRQAAPGEKTKVVVSAQPNLLPLITTQVSGNTLTVNIEGCVNASESIQIFVYSDGINALKNSGSGDISGEYELMSDSFEIELEGSGSITAMVRANEVEISQDGSGNMDITGNADKVSIDQEGSGNCEALQLQTKEARVNLKGSGTVSVFATREMNLGLHGSGNINYGGKPETLNTSDDGSGEIHEVQ